MAQLVERLAQSDSRNVVPGTTSGNALSRSSPRRIGPCSRVLRWAAARSGTSPARPARRVPARGAASPTDRAGRRAPGRTSRGCGRPSDRLACVTAWARWSKGRTPPRRRRAARSWSGLPLATSRISSKSRRPTLSTGSPSRIDAGVHVHVVDHPLVHRRVGRHLDARRRLEPQHAAAAGREDQHVGAAGDQAGGAGRVVTGRVHEDEPGLVDLRGIIGHVDQGRRAGLGQRAQRLLVDRRQAARLVARRRVVVDLGAEDAGVPLPPLDPLDQLLADLPRDGPRGSAGARRRRSRSSRRGRPSRPGRPAGRRRRPARGWPSRPSCRRSRRTPSPGRSSRPAARSASTNWPRASARRRPRRPPRPSA